MDAATIAAARRGDRRAQADILRALQDSWYRFCLSLLGNAEDARDATQESAIRLLKALPTFRGDSRLETFAMGISVNVVREMRRKRHVGEGTMPLRLAEETQDASPSVEVDRQEQWAILRETLADLPDRQREAVILRFFEDLSTEETARAMDCAVGTVKATVHQALRSLRERLKTIR